MSNEMSLSEITQQQENAGVPQAPVAEQVPQAGIPAAPMAQTTVAPQEEAPAPKAETTVPEFHDPHVPQSMQGGLAERLAEMTAEAAELEEVHGTPEELQKQRELEERKAIAALDKSTFEPEESIADVKKGNFKDEIIVEEDPEEKKEEAKGEVIDLTSIKIKKPKKGGATYARIRKSRESQNPTQQVVLPNTALIYDLGGYSSPDLRNIATTIRTMDAYRAAEYRFRQIFNKIQETSIGKLNWEEFLRCTSLLEVNILYYGLFCSTYPDTNKYPGKCTNPECRQQFEFDYPNSSLMYLNAERREEARAAVLNVLKNVNNAKELLENSEVNTVTRVLLEQSRTIVDLRHPSLWNELHDVLENVTQEMMVNDSVTINIMPFIENVYVLDPVDGNYVELESFDDKFIELSSLKEADDIKLSEKIGEIIEKYNIKFGFRGVQCPHCKAKMDDVDIDNVEDLLFTTHQLLTLKQ